jgi:hypothetical protein
MVLALAMAEVPDEKRRWKTVEDDLLTIHSDG